MGQLDHDFWLWLGALDKNGELGRDEKFSIL